MVEHGIVRDVDVELRGPAAKLAFAGHAERTADVLEAVGRLVLNWRTRGLLDEEFRIAAALDDKPPLDAMEDRPGVEAIRHVLKEVGHGYRRLVPKEFDRDVAERRGDHRNWIAWGRLERRRRHLCRGRLQNTEKEEGDQQHGDQFYAASRFTV